MTPPDDLPSPPPHRNDLLGLRLSCLGIAAFLLVLLGFSWLTSVSVGGIGGGLFQLTTIVAALVTVGLALVAAPPTRHPTALLAMVGAGIVVVGAGFGRPPVFGGLAPPPPSCSCTSAFLDRLDTSWPAVIAGLAVAAVAVGALVRRRRALGGRAGEVGVVVVSAVVSSVAVAAAVFAGAVVVPAIDHTGRPARRRKVVYEPDLPDEARVGWLRAARQEAEAVVAFVELSTRLAAVGAPADLTDRCRVAARDEARHARLCCRLARADGVSAPATITARAVGADPKRGVGWRRRAELVRLASESYLDGVDGEGESAALLAATARSSPDPGAARLIASIATDEETHAALAADVVAWCRAQSPWAVAVALHLARSRVTGAG